ncbi:UNVERIFIED_CONTAM: hypothetical protein NCL1_02097 [Trichonephila clavipes]
MRQTYHSKSFDQGLECGYPGAPSFGRPHPVKESYRPGDAVSFTCAHGHSLQGPLQRETNKSNGCTSQGLIVVYIRCEATRGQLAMDLVILSNGQLKRTSELESPLQITTPDPQEDFEPLQI